MKKFPVRAPQALCEAYHYPDPVPFSRGISFSLSGAKWIYLSGTASVDNRGRTAHVGDLQAQARHTFENLTALLGAEGAAWNDVVRTTVYLKNMDAYHEFNDVRNAFYREQALDPLPASTCVEARLCRDDLLVEIEAFAVVVAPHRRTRTIASRSRRKGQRPPTG